MADTVDTKSAKHDAYYEKRKQELHDAILSLFETDGVHLADVLGHDSIESRDDVEKLLAFALKHGDCHGKARMILLASEWAQACNELMEHE